MPGCLIVSHVIMSSKACHNWGDIYFLLKACGGACGNRGLLLLQGTWWQPSGDNCMYMHFLFDSILQNDDTDGCDNAVSKSPVSSEEEPVSRQMTVQIVRSAGVGLGISIAGGLGSCPFVDEDEVRTSSLFLYSFLVASFIHIFLHLHGSKLTISHWLSSSWISKCIFTWRLTIHASDWHFGLALHSCTCYKLN